ncbi:hypothetical protein IWW55_006484, partial [Coemansia sp. RSA 2706]
MPLTGCRHVGEMAPALGHTAYIAVTATLAAPHARGFWFLAMDTTLVPLLVHVQAGSAA